MFRKRKVGKHRYAGGPGRHRREEPESPESPEEPGRFPGLIEDQAPEPEDQNQWHYAESSDYIAPSSVSSSTLHGTEPGNSRASYKVSRPHMPR